MSNVVRLISASKSDFETMTPMDLKESIYKSEGRVIMGQHLLFAGAGLVRGVTNSELMFAFGSDMVLLNTIDLDNWDNNPGLQGLTYQELKARCGQRPIGVYLGCNLTLCAADSEQDCEAYYWFEEDEIQPGDGAELCEVLHLPETAAAPLDDAFDAEALPQLTSGLEAALGIALSPDSLLPRLGSAAAEWPGASFYKL